MWTADDLNELLAATKSYDRNQAERAVDRLISKTLSSAEAPAVDAAKKALTALRNVRYFDLLQRLADALMQAGQRAPIVQKLYAQSLIDLGAIRAAMVFLKGLVAEAADDPEELAEARGLAGRAAKQAYVNSEGTSNGRRELLREAVAAYYSVYKEDGSRLWHGINAVALIARGRRDGVDVSGWADDKTLAAEILEKAKALEKPTPWDRATAGEACVALGEWDRATEWYDRYLTSDWIDAFEIAGSLRQLREVWQIASGGPGSDLLIVLQAHLMGKEGGTAQLHDAARELSDHDAASGHLEAILGHDRYQPLVWYREGLQRAVAVARIGYGHQPAGTGFLMRGVDLHPKWSDEYVLVTNAHVISDTYRDAVRPSEALITFEAHPDAKRYRIDKILWSSPPGELDTTIARLNEPVAGVEPIPVAASLALKAERDRVYIIGHPGRGNLSFSMLDNLLLDYVEPLVHYRAPTEHGSSGSPVFDGQWRLLALHHSGGETMRRLRNPPGGTYAANEGIYIGSIKEALQRESVSHGKPRSPRRRLHRQVR